MPENLHIALDARTLLRPQRRGIGNAVLQLYRSLLAQRPAWHVTAFYDPPGCEQGVVARMHPQALHVSGHRFDMWTRLALPLAARNVGADVLHAPANQCPSHLRMPAVTTVHDVIPLERPRDYSPWVVRRFRRWIHTVNYCGGPVVTPSRYTCEQLLRHGFSAGRLHVAPWGPPPTRGEMTLNESEQLRRRFGLHRPYVLHFGADEPRKNTAALLRIWRQLPECLRRSWQLLVVGMDQPTVDDDVIFAGFVDEADVSALLAQAAVLAYPSLAEGFGLPLLEAMAAGTAVICSDAGSLPEVAGDAAHLTPAGDEQALAKGLVQLLEQPSHRREQVSRGRERVQQFSWNTCAKTYAAVLEDVVTR